MEKLARLLNEEKIKKILDVGTGTGSFISLITSCYDDYTELVGIDTISGAIKTARGYFTDKRIRFQIMDGNHMTYEDGYFDMLCLSNSLHHLENIEILFTEMGRVLKPGGVIVVSEMICNNLTRKQLSHLKIHHFAAKTDRLRGDSHNVTYSDKEILQILKSKTTFEIIKSWTLNLLRSKEDKDLPERFKWFADTVKKLIARVPKDLVTPELEQEGQEVVKYIKENGFDSCPTLVVVMKK